MLNTSFSIKHNLVIGEKEVTAIYKLEPIDLIILPEQDQQLFINDMQHLLASIQEGAIQIVMRTRKAIPNDFNNHFISMRDINSSETFKETNMHQDLVNGYIWQLSELLEKNIIPVKEYFLVFQQSLKNNKADELYKSVNILERNISRVACNVARAGIGIKQILNKDIEELLISFMR